MEIEYGRPARGADLVRTQALLASAGLSWDGGVEFTVNLTEGGVLRATGSRQKNVLKLIAVSPDYEGEGLIATVVSELVRDAHAAGLTHLFLFTKPKNAGIFGGLGFYTIAATRDAALLENRRGGIADYAAGLKNPAAAGNIGAIVANCNPFTNGHRFLAETAARECDFVYLFILSEDASEFSADVRFRLAKECVSGLANVTVCPTADYLISYATFPDYFIKDKAGAKRIQYELDLAVFSERIAKPLGITRRYVGAEPASPVTAGYNTAMGEILPAAGIAVRELPRCEEGGRVISASTVRALLAAGKTEEVMPLVPEPVYAYLKEYLGHA